MTRLNVRQTAKLLGVHENTIRNWAESGFIRCERLPRSGFRRFDPDEVERVRQLRTEEAMAMNDAEMSKMLFEARELISMFRAIVEIRAGKPDDWTRRVVTQIDAYRASKGWSPHGFGGETAAPDQEGANA